MPDSVDRNFIETIKGEIPSPLSEGERAILTVDASEQLLSDLEALLFVTTEPLPLQRLAALTDCSLEDVATAIAELEERYADRGITIRTVGGGYRFATAPRSRHAVESLLMPPKTSLSPAALETLAVVAYSQPVTKAEIEAVRGVSVDGVVNSLIEKGFLVEAGRKETLGRPMLFATTPEFLQSFGLPSLADLPPLPAEQAERLIHEASDEAKALEGTTESRIDSPAFAVEIIAIADDATTVSTENPERHDMLAESLSSNIDDELLQAQGEHLSQP